MMLYDWLIAPFVEFAFMRRALVGCLALAIGAAPIGVFLMLRRMSLIGDAMGHAILPGAAIGYLVSGLSLGAMTLGGMAAGFTVAILAGLVARNTTLREDTALAAFYILSLAAGVTLLSARGSNVDIFRVLFGSILGLDDDTLLLMVTVTSLTLLALAAFLRPLVLEFVDPGFLATQSRVGSAVHLAFLGLTVLNLVAAFHALGTLLAVGILILPAATARLWTVRLSALIVTSILLGFAAGVAGLLISYHASLASGPTIILVAGVMYLGSILFGRSGGLIRQLRPARHLEA
jgi:zinc/manganese transport system permease protein